MAHRLTGDGGHPKEKPVNNKNGLVPIPPLELAIDLGIAYNNRWSE